MADFASRLGASKAASTLLVFYIPSQDRYEDPIDQKYWVGEALTILGECFGGATAFPKGRGVWRDDAQAGHDPVLHERRSARYALGGSTNLPSAVGYRSASRGGGVGDRP